MVSLLPLSLAVGRFKQLPQRAAEVWQGGLVRLPAWVDDPDDPERPPYRPIGAMWISLRTGHVHLTMPPDRAAPSPELALTALVEFGLKQVKVLGGRPGRLEVNDPATAGVLAAALGGLNTTVEAVEALPALDAAVRDLEAAMNEGGRQPGVLDTPGVTVDRLRAFAEAAALFYSARPWRHLVNDDLLIVTAPRPSRGMAHVSVLGNGGEEFGLAFFESRRAFERLLDDADPTQADRAHGITFGPIDELPFADVDAWETHALPVADADAYPLPADLRADGSMRRPSAKALAYVEAPLRGLADTTEEELDSGRWSKRVDTIDGPVELTLSLPYILEADNLGKRPRVGFSPFTAERVNATVGRWIDEQHFASIEEMNAGLEAARRLGLFDRHQKATDGRELTPLERAQELVYDAGDAIGRLRIKLARQALALSADCADAHVMLGDAAASPEEAVEHYTRGLEAGMRAIGPDAFASLQGQFWGQMQTRPYMRACLALAEVLREVGRHEEAIAHFTDLLRLNPEDNQGIRYLLLPALLEHGQDAEAEQLLARYPTDVEATWPYARALLAFRREGDSAVARGALQEAVRANRHVAAYLIDPSRTPWNPADHVQQGSPDEAADVVDQLLPAFENTPNALAWLAAAARRRTTPGRKSPGRTLH